MIFPFFGTLGCRLCFFFFLPPKKAHFLVDIKRVDINEYRRIGHALIPGCICLSIPAQVKRINERKSSRKGGESVDKSRTSSVTTLKLVSLSSDLPIPDTT